MLTRDSGRAIIVAFFLLLAPAINSLPGSNRLGSGKRRLREIPIQNFPAFPKSQVSELLCRLYKQTPDRDGGRNAW